MQKEEESGDALMELQGIVERVIFYNEENGYAVCDLAAADENGNEILVTLVGTLPFLAEGETVCALGRWTVHPSFGRQFKAEAFEKALPADAASILKYLSSRTIKGIGPATAKKIVGKYGADSLDVIENHAQWLTEFAGITEQKAKEISESFKRQFGIRSVMLFCHDFFGPATAVRVYKRWGTQAVNLIRENPYILCDEIRGVGFERADRIARSLGLAENASSRIMAGICYVLRFNAAQNGHMFIPRDRLLPAAAQMLNVSAEETETALEALLTQGKLKSLARDGRECIYLDHYYEAERYSAAKLDRLDRDCPKLAMEDVERFLTWVESENHIRYAALQRKAIVNALTSGVMILTGGPGTGKTTVIRALITVFGHLGMKVALAAPTGRAAKRMSEATQSEAKTIHRLLEVEFSGEEETLHFRRGEDDPLTEDVLIVDEASMIDGLLLEALCRALHPGTRLLLIGDADQLPSVGAGNVLRDLIDSERFATVKLREIFRQAQESMIITNAHAINDGEYPLLDSKDNDFFFIHREREQEIAQTVADLWRIRLPRTYGEDIRQRIQVITPSRKGAAGTVMLNRLLQEALNPPAPEKRERKLREITFREQDKVMQIRNNYGISWEKIGLTGETVTGEGVFNGDIGVIESISANGTSMRVRFDDRVAEYDESMLEELEHAWAVTVHKSQGSEYPVVILPLYRCAPRLLTRNLLYTAITRAEQMVILIGTKDLVAGMVQNNRQAHRYTSLAYWLQVFDV